MFVRLSLSTPKAGNNRDAILAIEDDLLAFFGSQPGYIDGYRLTDSDQIGRVTIWESEAAAELAANAQHTLSVRSRLLPLIEANPTELALEGVRAPRR
jgi:hypothetical protein